MGEARKIKVKKIESKEGTISVTRTIIDWREGTVKSTKEKTQKIEIRPFATDTANVSIKMGATIPLKEAYAGARIDVMFSVPCYVEEMRDVFYQAKEIVDELMQEEVKSIKDDTEEDTEEEQESDDGIPY